MRPTKTLHAVIEGRLSHTDAPHWTRAGVSMAIYRHARHVLSQPTREARRAALDKVPEAIREDVETEAKRLWNANTQP